MSPQPWGLYVHVPWCRVRCPYCAFHVEPDRDAPYDAFVTRALAEVRWRSASFPGAPHTVYLGGGTPSRLPLGALERLLAGVVSPHTREVTVEANPEDVTPRWLEGARAAGVTRVSLGIQTLSPERARRLGRKRTADHARRAAGLVADAGLTSWSADLMFGLHAQTLDDLVEDLESLLSLQPPHVSLYGLTIEPDTPYERAEAAGRITPADEEVWRAMYGHLVSRLDQAGLARYEVSNFARPGHESLHNRSYWQDRPYMGVGPSAHGYAPDGTRWVDVADTARWLAMEDPTASQERPEGAEAATDLLVAGLRGVAGVSLSRLAARTGHLPDSATRGRLIEAGLLVEEADRMRLGDEGFYVADAVTSSLVRALRPVDPPAGRG